MSNFLLISSDIHSDPISFKKLADLASDKDCLSFLFCGDINLENWEINEILRTRNFSFIPVLGNCDTPWTYRDLNMQTPPYFRKTEFLGLKIFFTHGHYLSIPCDAGFENNSFDIVINGHSHVPALERQENFVFLNPGSPSLPRGYNEPSYATIEFEESEAIICLRKLADNNCFSELRIPLKK